MFRKKLRLESLETRSLLTTLVDVSDELVIEQRLVGDVDANGHVGTEDVVVLEQNFGLQEAQWNQGDLNGNGTVDFADFLRLADSYQQPAASTAAA